MPLLPFHLGLNTHLPEALQPNGLRSREKRLAAARRAFDVLNTTADDAEHTAPHRLNFRKFWHGASEINVGWTILSVLHHSRDLNPVFP